MSSQPTEKFGVEGGVLLVLLTSASPFVVFQG